ncbi:hypothetical protein VSVS05_03215 [Vibrio scophthalmi]|uniref:Uncharacterized protein n=1 Tax=Vibrio scophthalmi TaxID=45658 RepID=A0A1C7FFQ9_9VIBR|nr:hypothetical protein VSVS05_03215 [Vibrio scophthalmi]
MAICRLNCQGNWLIEKYAHSDFEPEKQDEQTSRKLE